MHFSRGPIGNRICSSSIHFVELTQVQQVSSGWFLDSYTICDRNLKELQGRFWNRLSPVWSWHLCKETEPHEITLSGQTVKNLWQHRTQIWGVFFSVRWWSRWHFGNLYLNNRSDKMRRVIRDMFTEIRVQEHNIPSLSVWKSRKRGSCSPVILFRSDPLQTLKPVCSDQLHLVTSFLWLFCSQLRVVWVTQQTARTREVQEYAVSVRYNPTFRGLKIPKRVPDRPVDPKTCFERDLIVSRARRSVWRCLKDHSVQFNSSNSDLSDWLDRRAPHVLTI